MKLALGFLEIVMKSISSNEIFASLRQNFIDSEGNPAQCLILLIRSSSIAHNITPSLSKQADESPWYAFIPKIYIYNLLIFLINISTITLQS